jgi:RNA polymerase sigma-70 factor, ECF subfamily
MMNDMESAPDGQPTSDEQLWAAYVESGKPESLGTLFHRRAPDLARLAAALTQSPSDVDDLVQETFVAAIRSATSFRSENRLMPWLCGILCNRIRSWRRTRSTSAMTDIPMEAPPAAALLRQELHRELERALDTLQPPYREVVLLHLNDDLTSVEIGERLQRQPATVRKQLSRGLDALRVALPTGLASGLFTQANVAQIWPRIASAAEATTNSVAAVAGATVLRRGAGLWGRLAALTLVAGTAAGAFTFWNRPVTPALQSGPDLTSTVLQAPRLAPTASESQGQSTRSETPPAPTESLAWTRTLLIPVRFRDDSPAAGVTMALTPDISGPRSGQTLRDRKTTTVDKDGYATFHSLTPGSYSFSEVSQGATQSVSVSGGSQIDVLVDALIVDGPFHYEGTVVDRDQRPLAGATLWTSAGGDLAAWTTPVATTDDLGRFRVSLCVRSPRLFATYPGLEASVVYKVLTERQAKIALQDQSRTVPIQVVDELGNPLEGALCTLTRSARLEDRIDLSHHAVLRAVTDSSGRCEIPDASRATSFLAVHAPGHAVSHMASIDAIPPAGLIVACERGATVTVQVVDAHGRPAPGIVVQRTDATETIPVHLRSLTQMVGKTDQAGQLTLLHCPTGPSTFHFLRETQLPTRRGTPAVLAVKSVNVPTTGLLVEASVPEDYVLVGTVVDARGQPLAGWHVQATPAWLQNPEVARFRTIPAITDSNGRFAIHDVGTSIQRLSVSDPKQFEQDPNDFPQLVITAQASQNPVRCVVPERTCHEVIGLVAPGTRVTVIQLTSDVGRRIPVSDGRFSISLAEDDYALRLGGVDVDGYDGNSYVMPLSVRGPVDLGFLERRPAAALTVTLPPGATSARCVLRGIGNVYYKSRPDGASHMFSGIAPGTYELETSALEIPARRQAVVVTPGENHVEIETPRAPVRQVCLQVVSDVASCPTPTEGLSILLTDSAGAGLVHTSVRMKQEDSTYSARFLTGLVAGSYCLLTESSRGGSCRLTFDVEPGDDVLVVRAVLKYTR